MVKIEKNKEEKLWDKKVLLLIVIALILITFSFIAPLIFSKLSWGAEFDERTGVIGDTIGGIMNPFLALAGVLITFLAFYMQLRANRIQIDNFKEELKVQKEESRIRQFEAQYYEMLRFHKENVNELEISVAERDANGNFIYKTVRGRDVFRYFANELEMVYNYIVEIDFATKDQFGLAYSAFFNGAINQFEYEELEVFMMKFKTEFLTSGEISTENKELDSFYNTTPIARYSLLKGHENLLGHYYRHLYHTVKFIALEDEKFISYYQKRNYLRILRAQLSNYEQLMLFYNYLVYAPEWEVDNKFLSEYRMIHNLYPALLYDSKYLKAKYEELKSKQKDVRSYKKNDHIFEAQKHD